MGYEYPIRQDDLEKVQKHGARFVTRLTFLEN